MNVLASTTRTLLNSMADWQLFLLIVGGTLAAARLGLLGTRRYLAPLPRPGTPASWRA